MQRVVNLTLLRLHPALVLITELHSIGLNPHCMTVDVQFNEVDHPARLANPQATIYLSHCACAGQEQAILPLAEHCLIYETTCS